MADRLLIGVKLFALRHIFGIPNDQFGGGAAKILHPHRRRQADAAKAFQQSCGRLRAVDRGKLHRPAADIFHNRNPRGIQNISAGAGDNQQIAIPRDHPRHGGADHLFHQRQ